MEKLPNPQTTTIKTHKTMGNDLKTALEELIYNMKEKKFREEIILEEIEKCLAKAALKEDGWIDVKDRPLFKKLDSILWVITEDGEGDFIAAVPYNDKTRPNENLWWIRHCRIEESVLYVVCDTDTEAAGWLLQDVTHYFPLPQPPPAKICQT